MTELRSLFPDSESDIPVQFRPPAPVDVVDYLVGGQLRRWDGKKVTVHSPIAIGSQLTPRHLGSCPDMDEKAGRAALRAACEAYDNGLGAWPVMAVAERIGHVERLMERMAARRDDIVRLMMWEIAKPYAECCIEFDRTLDNVRDTIAALRDMDEQSGQPIHTQGIDAYIRRVPIGPTLCMGPFNFPLNETFATLIPALLMGNTAVLTPPKLGRLLFAPLLEDFRDSFPPGVINLVWGADKLVRAMLETGDVNVLAFIGSSDAAQELRCIHPKPNRLRCVLGMGAKNAAIVTESANMDLAVNEALAGSLAFSGQRCTALKLFFVHQSRMDEFIKRFVENLHSMPVGMPWQKDVRITPLPEPGKTGYLADLVQDAVTLGAQIANPDGGEHAATLFHPTVLSSVNSDMRIFHEEQFGPVVPVVSFTDLDVPVRAIAESRYGQQASIFSDDPEEMTRLVGQLANQVCRVNINSLCQRGPDTLPFAGRRDSAEGALSVTDALHRFSIRTVIAAKTSDRNQRLLKRCI